MRAHDFLANSWKFGTAFDSIRESQFTRKCWVLRSRKYFLEKIIIYIYIYIYIYICFFSTFLIKLISYPSSPWTKKEKHLQKLNRQKLDKLLIKELDSFSNIILCKLYLPIRESLLSIKDTRKTIHVFI